MDNIGFTWMNTKKEESAAFEVREGVLIIEPFKDLDHHNALFIKEQADRLIEHQNIKHIVFDFEHVDFMDSSGIGVIMGRYKKVIFIGGRAAVIHVGSPVERIMRMAGLYKIIEKYNNIEDALENLTIK